LSKNHTREDLVFMKKLIQCAKSSKKAIIVIWLGDEKHMLKLPDNYSTIILNESSLHNETSLEKLDSFINRLLESAQNYNPTEKLVEMRLFSIMKVENGKIGLISINNVDLFFDDEIIIKPNNGSLKLYNIQTGKLVSVIQTDWSEIAYCWIAHLQNFLVVSKKPNKNFSTFASLFDKSGQIRQSLEISRFVFSWIHCIVYSQTSKKVFIIYSESYDKIIKELNENFELNDSELKIYGTPTVFNDYIYIQDNKRFSVYDLKFCLLRQVNYLLSV